MLSIDTLLNFLGQSLFERALSIALLAAACYLIYRWIAQPLFVAIKGMWNFWRLRHAPASFLEVTPPASPEKQTAATDQLFAILRRLSSDRAPISVEIISSRKDGIRYIVRAHPSDVPALQRQIASYLPEAQFRALDSVDLPFEAAGRPAHVIEIKQTNHYAYPLQSQDDLSVSDPVAYLAGAMTKLEPNETIAMQMVLAPHNSRWTARLAAKIMQRGYAIIGIDNQIWNFFVTRWIMWVIAIAIGILYSNGLLALQVAILLTVISFFIKREEPVLNQGEQELYADILSKLQRPLFRADIRILIAANSEARFSDLANGLTGSLGPLGASMQALYGQRLHPEWLGQKIGRFKFEHRLSSFLVFDSNVLSASELASIYHFPYGTITTEGMVRSHSRTLPATLDMKNNKFDVVLGQNNHHGEVTPVGLTAAERERHVFIIGGTGNGKTTMLQYAIAQDVQSGKCVAVVDPHGDMAETLLRHVPEDRIKDVIYFNPDDLAHPIGLNLLELTPGLDGDDLLREKDIVTESVVSVFRKIFSDDDTGGHRIEYILRNTIQTALYVKNATLFTVYDLLNDPAYRKQVLKTIDDKNLQNFWKQELGKAGDMQKVKMAAGITAKIGRFLFSASAKRILEQPHSTINFDEILDGKILICNFSKGLLGEDTSELFGIAVLAKIQLAALRRARFKQADRKPFYLYVDEFQNFATPSFVQMLSEARKYKLYLTMAEQTTSQQDEQQMVDIILANVGTVICFRSGNPDDERLMLPLFKPYIEEGEIASLPSYNFYMRVAAQKSQEPLSGETIVLEEKEDKLVGKIIVSSRKKYSSRPLKNNKTSREQEHTKVQLPQ